MDPTLVTRLENVANRMEGILQKYDSANITQTSGGAVDCPKTNGKSRVVELLDVALDQKLGKLYQLSEEIGDDVERIVDITKAAFSAHRSFLIMAAGREQPDSTEFASLVKDLSEKITSISAFKEKNRSSAFYDHICAIDASACGLGWVAVPKTPAPFLKDAVDMALFYINRIFVAFKGKDERHFEWAKTLKELWLSLHEYVRANHTTGLVWKQASTVGTTAPPPPPPPPMLVQTTAPTDKVTALLESLNTGLDATSRLKKVTPDMQTHKNPSLRARDSAVRKTGTGKSVGKTVKKEEARIFWDGKIWRVDHQVGNSTAQVEVKEKKESIYIYKCSDCVISIKGKANAITLDNCVRTSVVFDGLVAQCEVINCQSVRVQTLGALPTVSIQKTDGCHVYLSREASGAQIVASKSSEMNVSAQLDDENDEYSEMALPEQFVTRIIGKKLRTIASEIV